MTQTPTLPVAAPSSTAAPPSIDSLLAALLKAIRDGDDDEARRLLALLRAIAEPPPVPDEKNAALVYAKAFELLGTIKLSEEEQRIYDLALGGEVSPQDLPALRAILEKHADVLKFLREAAKMPDCRFPVAYEDGFSALLPHIAPMIKSGKLLGVEALVARLDGRSIEADTSLMKLAMARAIRTDAILISQLVGNVVDGGGGDDLMRAFDAGATEVIAHIGALDPASLRADYRRSLVVEVTAVVDLFLSKDDRGGALGEGMADFLKDPMRRHDIGFYLENMSEMMSLSARPYGETREALEAIENRVKAAPWYAEGTKMVMPALSRAAERIATAESHLVKARLAVALKSYHGAYGAYPASLDVLGAPPRDPLTGQPFVYRREGGGFVIESFGLPESIWRAAK